MPRWLAEVDEGGALVACGDVIVAELRKGNLGELGKDGLLRDLELTGKRLLPIFDRSGNVHCRL